MAKAVINLQKESGGITKISSADGTGVTELIVPESGMLATLESPTFTGSVVVPTPTTGTQAVNKDYVDTGAGVAFIANDNRVKTALNATGTAPIYAYRAWVNFNGTGTVAIRESGNVSSITDDGVGFYTMNFATAMPDANYSMGGMSRQDLNTGSIGIVAIRFQTVLTPSSFKIETGNDSGTKYDMTYVTLQVCR